MAHVVWFKIQVLGFHLHYVMQMVDEAALFARGCVHHVTRHEGNGHCNAPGGGRVMMVMRDA